MTRVSPTTGQGRGDDGPRPGRLVAFVGAKGGVGTTTLAANTAAFVAKSSVTAPLLVDLHLTRGDVAVFMGTEPRFSVLDALENLRTGDESFLADLIETAAANVRVLASSRRHTHIHASIAALRALLDFATCRFPLTIVDVPRTDAAALEALDRASAIVLVTSQELPSVRAAAATAARLRVRYGPQKLRVVINRYDRRGAVTAKDVARVMGEPIAYAIPSDYRAAVEAINVGQPVVLGNSGLARAIGLMAADLSGTPKAKRTRSVFGRLPWRRGPSSP